MGDKHGKTGVSLSWMVEELVAAGYLAGTGVVEAVATLALFANQIFHILLIVLVGEGARLVILRLMVDMAGHAVFFAHVLNAIDTILNIGYNVAYDEVSAFIMFVNHDIIQGFLNPVAHFLGQRSLSSIPFHGQRWKGFQHVSPDQFRAWLLSVPPICTNYESAGAIVLRLVQFGVGRVTCAYERLLRPIDLVYSTHVFYTLMSWSHRGGAAAELHNNATNCVPANIPLESQDIVCIGLGIPFLMYDFYLKIVILHAVLPSLMPAIRKFIYLAWKIFLVSTHDAFEIVEVTIKIFAGL
jgi:hypothetical protein